jgi:phosphatidylserine/phosphatidylglycerophosphate/cardiolipin synthase-like enzyme
MPSSRPDGNLHRILLYAGLLLASTAAIPAAAFATVPSAAIDTCFAPESDCAAFAVRAIDHAEREILVGAYGLTTGAGIDPLTSAGVPVWIDHSARIAHAKTMVIDGTVTLNGSYNWTRGAAENSEDLNLFASPAVAEAYAAHWRDRQARSLRFDRREGWCRAGVR